MSAISTTSYRDHTPAHDEGVVVDLSRFAERLAKYEDISADLTPDEEAKIVGYIKACHDMSHSRISKRYDHWIEADRAHDVWVPPEATSFREKAVIADTRAIADTVLTYMMAALTGRNPMFQLEGLNRKSRKVAPILERVLHMQMRRTGAEARLAQLFLDKIRYGFAPTKCIWDAKNNQNRIINFDPRRAFPDPRVSWGDWENMGFIIFSDFLPFSSLAASGNYPKLKQFPGLRFRQSAITNGWAGHRFHKEEGRGLSIDPARPMDGRTSGNVFALGDSRVFDEAWVRMSGHEIGIPSIDMIWLVITILDENVVIRFQINPYGQQFPVVIGGLFQDSHKTYSQSLYDLLLPMHDIATWLLRSRIDNVQAALNNLIFVDPTQVAVSDLIDRNPWGVVRTLAGSKPGDGVFIAQVPDVTRGHWQDIQAMSDLKQRVAAAGDAQQGMPTADGVRTATEIARLTQLGSQRLGVLSRIASATTVRPLVNMMVGNIQDALSYTGSVRVDPENMPGHLADVVNDGYIDFDVAKDLQGQIDYLVIDGTLPIEPTRNAETWMNMLGVMQQTGLHTEYKAGKIAEEAIRALGVSDLDRFRISPEERAQGPSPSQQYAMMEQARGASVMPQEQLQQEIQKGNLIPQSQAGRQ